MAIRGVCLAVVRTSTQVPGFRRSNLDLGALAVGRRSLAARSEVGRVYFDPLSGLKPP